MHWKFFVDELNNLLIREFLSCASMWWEKCQVVIEFMPPCEELVEGCCLIETYFG
jgi:hypothetical protein